MLSRLRRSWGAGIRGAEDEDAELTIEPDEELKEELRDSETLRCAADVEEALLTMLDVDDDD